MDIDLETAELVYGKLLELESQMRNKLEKKPNWDPEETCRTGTTSMFEAKSMIESITSILLAFELHPKLQV